MGIKITFNNLNETIVNSSALISNTNIVKSWAYKLGFKNLIKIKKVLTVKISLNYHLCGD